MDKINIDDLNLEQLKLLKESIFDLVPSYKIFKSRIYELDSNYIIKIFNPRFLEILLRQNISIEKKIMYSDSFKNNEGIIIPSKIVLSQGSFIGYVIPKIKNFKDETTYSHDLLSSDLKSRTNLLIKKENVIKNNPDIVFPDMLSSGNILIKDNNPIFIDYDEWQIKDMPATSYSSNLGYESIYHIDKYKSHNTHLYTKNLDKKSIILDLYLSLFKINLQDSFMVNVVNHSDINDFFKDLFSTCNIENKGIIEATLIAFLSENEDNLYISEYLEELSQEYKLENIKNSKIKRLIRK